MAFALSMFSAEDDLSLPHFPGLLFTDEVDAPLHPSMIRSLLRAIQKALVEKYGMCVILATHSATTIALAPPESLHVMTKHGTPRITRTTRDRALGLLTAGVLLSALNTKTVDRSL